jgi:hypothetical protein
VFIIAVLLRSGLAMRFNRALSDEFEAHLSPGQPLHFLVHRPTAGTDHIPLVPHVREDDHLMLYAGRSVVVDLQFTRKSFKPRADGSYEMKAHGVESVYTHDAVPKLADDLERYLAVVSPNPSFVEGEARCHAWLCRRFGPAACPEDWATVDSEVVIGYENTGDRKRLREPIDWMCDLARRAAISSPDGPPADSAKRSYRELGLMIWDPRHAAFLAVEVKDGSANDICWSPLQVACYVAEWRIFAAIALEQAREGLRQLFIQRQRLGLINADCPVPGDTAPLRFRPVIVVQSPCSTCCWVKFAEVRSAVERAALQVGLCSPNVDLLGDLSIWEQHDDQLTDVTQECTRWGVNRRSPQP